MISYRKDMSIVLDCLRTQFPRHWEFNKTKINNFWIIWWVVHELIIRLRIDVCEYGKWVTQSKRVGYELTCVQPNLPSST